MAVPKPPIEWFPAHPQNVLARPAGLVFEGICTHTTAGGTTVEQLGAWFGGLNIQQGLRGSTHFGVDRVGAVAQFVSLDASAIAHGQEPSSTAFLVRENPGISMNHVVIGVEHLDGGVPGSVTPVQLEASAWLYAWIFETYIQPHAWKTGAKLDLNHFVQHKDFAPSSKPLCASWPQLRMQQHLDRIAAYLTPPKPDPEPEPEPVPPTPEPDPVTDWETKYAQLDREVEVWLTDDTVGAEMRRQRLAELRSWQP